MRGGAIVHFASGHLRKSKKGHTSNSATTNPTEKNISPLFFMLVLYIQFQDPYSVGS